MRKRQKKSTSNLLMTIAGANQDIINRPECINDRPRFTFIALGLIGSFISSSVAVTVALLFVLDLLEAISLGVFIGFLIFNLNRSLTISTRKNKDIKKNAFPMSILSHIKALGPVAVKLAISLPLSFLVAVPIELALFSSSIESRRAEENLRIAEEDQNNRTIHLSEIEQLNTEQDNILRRRVEKQERRDRAFSEAMAENDGLAGTLIPGRGPVFTEKYAEFERLNLEYQNYVDQSQQRINSITQRIEQLEDDRNKQLQNLQENRMNEDLLMNIKIFNLILKENQELSVIVYLIRIFFILLDTSPLLINLFFERSNYDLAIDYFDEQNTLALDYQHNVNSKIYDFQWQEFIETLSHIHEHPEYQVIMNELQENILQKINNSNTNMVERVWKSSYSEQEIENLIKEEIEKYLRKNVKHDIHKIGIKKLSENLKEEIADLLKKMKHKRR